MSTQPKQQPQVPLQPQTQPQNQPQPPLLQIQQQQSQKQISIDTKSKLLVYQPQHVNGVVYSLKKYNRALDASDTGTGKTYTAIAACIELGLKPFIICPKSVLTSWTSVIQHFGAKFYGISNYELIQNCKYFQDISLTHKLKCQYIRRQKNIAVSKKNNNPGSTKDNYTYRWQNLPNDMIIIFDEAHRCKNNRTVASVLLYTAAQTTHKILMLSATIADKPENFALAGYVLGLYQNKRHAMSWIESVGKDCSNIMIGVQKRIYPEYASRMRIRDLGTLFPHNQIVAQCYDMDCAEEIQKQYKLIEDEVTKLKKKEDASQNPLARIMYARMRIEQLKIPTFLELIKKYLAEGNAVAVFVNFTMTLKTIADELKTQCLIYGEQTLLERTNNIADFNYDRSQIIICNIRSGGVGVSLHDTHGKFPRVSIISPSWSAQDIVQALGRVHRADGKTPVRQRLVFCKGTVEEDICRNMSEKIVNIASLNDADILSYQIEGLIKVGEGGIGDDLDMTEYEETLQKITVLQIKRQRLRDDLQEVEDDMVELKQKLNYLKLTGQTSTKKYKSSSHMSSTTGHVLGHGPGTNTQHHNYPDHHHHHHSKILPKSKISIKKK